MPRPGEAHAALLAAIAAHDDGGSDLARADIQQASDNRERRPPAFAALQHVMASRAQSGALWGERPGRIATACPACAGRRRRGGPIRALRRSVLRANCSRPSTSRSAPSSMREPFLRTSVQRRAPMRSARSKLLGDVGMPAESREQQRLRPCRRPRRRSAADASSAVRPQRPEHAARRIDEILVPPGSTGPPARARALRRAKRREKCG